MAGRDKVFGAILILIALGLGAAYGWAYFGGYAAWGAYITISVIVALTLSMVAWIGYTIMTTPSIQEIQTRK